MVGLISFMTGADNSAGVEMSSDYTKRKLATESLAFNMGNDNFRKLFTQYFK